jgi:hypothetical protein
MEAGRINCLHVEIWHQDTESATPQKGYPKEENRNLAKTPQMK